MFCHTIVLWYLCPRGKNMNLLTLMSVMWKYLRLGNAGNKRSTWFAENPFLTRHDLCVCVWRLQSSSCTSTAQMMAVGVLSAMEEATGAFPALAHGSCPSAYQAKCKARAEWYFRRDLQQVKLWLDVEIKTASISEFFLNQGVLTLRSKIWEWFTFGDLVNSNCIINFLWIFLFYLLLS